MWLLEYFTTVLLLSVFTIDIADCKTQKVFLNSNRDCAKDHEVYIVSVFQDYVIKPDVSPNTKSHIFRDCEMTFGSARKHGHVCLILVGNQGTITDQNAQLEAKDGLGNPNDKEIDVLVPFSRTWSHREYCSQDAYITLYLHRIRRGSSASIRNVNIEFKVLDIESKDRKLYLDGSYCSHTYYLENSMVTLWNRPNFPGMTVTTLTSECPIRFDKMEQDNHNKSICFAYIPSKHMTCDSQWSFIISTADFDLDERFFVYSMSCNATEAKNIHVWCAKPTQNFVTVIFMRNGNILSNSSIEPSKDFRYIVMDYEGTEASLLGKVSNLYGDTDSSSLADKWMIYTIAAIAVVIVLVIVFIICKRRMSYKAVDSEDDSKAI